MPQPSVTTGVVALSTPTLPFSAKTLVVASRSMLIGERVAERLQLTGLSQAELARRVGVSQQAIGKLVHGTSRSTSHLHRIARALGTTPAYLTGETDDPDADAPAPEELSHYQRELLACVDRLAHADQQALLTIARSMAGGPSEPGRLHEDATDYRGD